MDLLGQSSASSVIASQNNDFKDNRHQVQLADCTELLERRVSSLQTRLSAYAESLRRSCQCSNQLLESFLELLRDTPLAQVALASQDAAKSLDDSASRAQAQLANEAGEALHRFSLVLPELKNAFRRSSQLQHELQRQDGDANGTESIDTRQTCSSGEKSNKELSTDDELKSARELNAKRMELVGAALLSCLHSTGKLWTHGSELFSPFAKYRHVGQLLRNSRQVVQVKDATAKWLALSQSNKSLRQCGSLTHHDLHCLVHCDQMDIPAAAHEQLCQTSDSLLQAYKLEYDAIQPSRVTVPAGFHLNPKGIELALRGCCSTAEAQAAGVDLYPTSRSSLRLEDMVRVPCCIDGHLFEAGSGSEAFDLRVRSLHELIQWAVGDGDVTAGSMNGLEQEVLWHACSGVAHVACRVAVQLLFGKAQLVVIKPSRDCQEQIPDIAVSGTEIKISVPTTWWIVEDWPLLRVLRSSSKVQVLGVVKAVYRSTINVAACTEGHGASTLPVIDVNKEAYHDDGSKFFEFGSAFGHDRSIASGLLSPSLNEPNRGLRGSIDRASESIRTAVQAVRGRMKRGEARLSKFYVPAPQDSEQVKPVDGSPHKGEVRSPPSIVVTKTDLGSVATGQSADNTFASEPTEGKIADGRTVPGILQDSEAFFGYLETNGIARENGMVSREDLERIISMLSLSHGTYTSFGHAHTTQPHDQSVLDSDQNPPNTLLRELGDSLSNRKSLRSQSETSVETLKGLCTNNYPARLDRVLSDSPQTIKIIEEFGSIVPAMRARERLGEDRDDVPTDKESAIDEDEEGEDDEEDPSGPLKVKSLCDDDDEWSGFSKKSIGKVPRPFQGDFHPHVYMPESAEQSGVSGTSSPLTVASAVLPPACDHNESSVIWKNSNAVGVVGDGQWPPMSHLQSSRLHQGHHSRSWSTLADNTDNNPVRCRVLPDSTSRGRPPGPRDSTDLDLAMLPPDEEHCQTIYDDAESTNSNGSDSNSSSSSLILRKQLGSLTFDPSGQKGTSTWPRTNKVPLVGWGQQSESDETWPSKLFVPAMTSAASQPDVRTQTPPMPSIQTRHPSEGQIHKLAQVKHHDDDKPPPLPPRSYRPQQHQHQLPPMHPAYQQRPPPSNAHGDWSMPTHPPPQHQHPHPHHNPMGPMEPHHSNMQGGGPPPPPFAAPPRPPWAGPPNHPHPGPPPPPPPGHWSHQQSYFVPRHGHPSGPPVHDVPPAMHGPGPMHQPPRPYPPPMHGRGNYNQMHEIDQPPPGHCANTSGYDGYGPAPHGPSPHPHPRMMGPGYGQHLHPEEARRPHTWGHNRQYPPGPQYDYYQNQPPMPGPPPPPVPPRTGQSGHPPPSGPPPNGPPPSGQPPNGPPPFAAPRHPPNMVADDWGPADNWVRPEPQLYRYPGPPASVRVSTM